MAGKKVEKVEKKETIITVVKMSDGREVPFAGRKKLIVDNSVEDNLLTVICDVANGDTCTYTRTLPEVENFEKECIIYAITQKLKSVITGAKETSDILPLLKSKIVEFGNDEFSTRRTGKVSLSLSEQAYLLSKDLDLVSTEDQISVKNELSAMSKEERKEIFKTPGVILKKAELTYEVARKNVESLEEVE